MPFPPTGWWCATADCANGSSKRKARGLPGWRDERSRAVESLPEIEAIARALPDGAVVEVSPAAEAWFESAASLLDRGLALIIDYGYPAATLYAGHRLAGTLRAYQGQRVTDDPFEDPGEVDLTTHVDFSALERAGIRSGLEPAGFTNQGDFLAALGMGMFLVDLQQEPGISAEDYLSAKAAIFRLIEPGGLGRFRRAWDDTRSRSGPATHRVSTVNSRSDRQCKRSGYERARHHSDSHR